MLKHKMLFFEGETGGGSGGGAGGSGDGTGNATLLSDSGGQGGSGGGQGSSSGEPSKFLVGHDGAFTENWTNTLPEALFKKADGTDSRAGLAKFRNLADFARSYHEMEAKQGSKATMVAIPSDKSTPEEIAAYRKAAGIPEKPEDYKLTPEKFPEGVAPWAPEMIAPFEKIAHENNVSPKAMQAFIAENLRQQQMGVVAQQDAVKAHLEAGEKTLQKDFGADYQKNIGLATAACKTAGIDPRSHGFSDPNVVKTVVQLAKMLSDDKLVKGGGLDGGTTLSGPARAKDIQGNKENPLYAKYRDGDADTIALVRRLNSQE